MYSKDTIWTKTHSIGKLYKLMYITDLDNMYTLLKPIHGGLGLLVQEVEAHIKATALDAVKRLKGENVSQLKSNSYLSYCIYSTY